MLPSGRRLLVLLIAAILGCSAPAYGEPDLTAQARTYMSDTNDHARLQKAIVMLTRLIEQQPSNAGAYLSRGLCKCWVNEWPEGIKDLEKSATLDPSLADPWVHLINAYVQQKRMPEALKAARHLQQLKPSESFGFIGEANILEASGQLPQALELLTKCEKNKQLAAGMDKILDHKLDVCLKLANQNLFAGRTDLCRKYVNAAPKIPRGKTHLITLEANCLIREKQYQKAYAELKKIPTGDQHYQRGLLSLASCSINLKQWEEARALLKKAEPLADTDIQWWHMGVMLADHDKDSERASYCLEILCRLEPNNSYWPRLLSKNMAVGKRYTKAIEAAERVADLEPYDSGNLTHLLSLYTQVKNRTKQRQTAQRLIAGYNLAHQRALENEAIGDLLSSIGHYQSASDQYKLSLRSEENNKAVRQKQAALEERAP